MGVANVKTMWGQTDKLRKILALSNYTDTIKAFHLVCPCESEVEGGCGGRDGERKGG